MAKLIQKVETNPAGGKELEFAGLVMRDEFSPEIFGWQTETVSGAVIRPDTTTFECESEKLKLAVIKNILYSEDVATPGSMGLIVSIGSPYTMEVADWERIHGLKFLYVAEPDNWFNIYNSAELEGYDHKPILTGTSGNIYFVQRALFSYDSVLFQWVLLDYVPAQWAQQYGITGAPNTDIEVVHYLPQIGYYHFDIAVSVSETIDAVTENTGSPQTLTIKASGDPTYGESNTVDVSDIYDPGVGGMTKMLSTHLQGSGLIYVNYDENGDLKMYVNVTLPNGTLQAITGGYLHLKYHGKFINY
jgi:hypothetical protein